MPLKDMGKAGIFFKVEAVFLIVIIFMASSWLVLRFEKNVERKVSFPGLCVEKRQEIDIAFVSICNIYPFLTEKF